jgi:selenide,water dikinase
MVYRISNDLALIQTTDFFPPVCPDAYDFGQIAAANALSDVFAMGGLPLTALNIAVFPSAKLDLEILQEILRGGAEKVIEAGAILAGGHTIDGDIPIYGLSVTGSVHPDKIITNASAKPGDLLVLTKPLGSGIINAGKRIGEIDEKRYMLALNTMKQIHKNAVQILQNLGITCATDITGFGLCGHALEIAKASNVSIAFDTETLPLLEGVNELLEMGCIPGAAFRNLKHVDNDLSVNENVEYNKKMVTFDAQTSGGLLICVQEDNAESLIDQLHDAGFLKSRVIGEVKPKNDFYINLY